MFSAAARGWLRADIQGALGIVVVMADGLMLPQQNHPFVLASKIKKETKDQRDDARVHRPYTEFI